VIFKIIIVLRLYIARQTLKYRILIIFPILSIGGSIGLAPIQDRVMNDRVSTHVFFISVGVVFTDFFFFVAFAMINTDIPSATTPPSLEGMDRRIAYANKKYHSGWMWMGVTRGLAVDLFSTSMFIFGIVRTIRQ
jgi:hypothetical protein